MSLNALIITIMMPLLINEQLNCIEARSNCLIMSCQKSLIDKTRTVITTQPVSNNECDDCDNCAKTGYSICVSEMSSQQFRGVIRNKCICMHNIPDSCNPESHHERTNTSNYRLCYSHALHKLPMLLTVQGSNLINMIVEAFWRSDYWKSLNISNLTLLYEFAVDAAKYCDGEVMIDGEEIICRGFVPIEMYDTDTDFGDFDATNEQQSIEEYYEEDGHSEVQFDMGVFGGAKSARFWCTVEVHQPRLLNAKGHITDVYSVAYSDDLVLNLDSVDLELNEDDSIGVKNNVMETVLDTDHGRRSGSHPDEISKTGRIENDAKNRDQSFNAGKTKKRPGKISDETSGSEYGFINGVSTLDTPIVINGSGSSVNYAKEIGNGISNSSTYADGSTKTNAVTDIYQRQLSQNSIIIICSIGAVAAIISTLLGYFCYRNRNKFCSTHNSSQTYTKGNNEKFNETFEKKRHYG